MAVNWRVFGPETIACRLDKSELPRWGLFGKRITVPPGEAAIVVCQGKVDQVITEGNCKVTGIVDRVAELFRKGVDLQILMIDTSKFDLRIFFGNTSIGERASRASRQSSRNASRDTSVVASSSDDYRQKQEYSGLAKDTMGQCDKPEWRSAKWLHSVLGYKYGRRSHKAHGRGLDEIASFADVGLGLATSKRTHDTETARTKNLVQERIDRSGLTLLAISSDGEVVQGECKLRMHVRQDELNSFIQLMHGVDAIGHQDLALFMKDELLSRVFIPQVAAVDSSKLRADLSIRNRVEKDVHSALGATMFSYGLELLDFNIAWGVTDAELVTLHRRQQEHEEEALDIVHQREKAATERGHDLRRQRLENEKELIK